VSSYKEQLAFLAGSRHILDRTSWIDRDTKTIVF